MFGLYQRYINFVARLLSNADPRWIQSYRTVLVLKGAGLWRW